MAGRGGFAAPRSKVASDQVNRPLESHERVHHKNGRRDDNRPENLELWKGATPEHPAGVRASDYHCAGCRCHEIPIESINVFELARTAPMIFN
jgi:hypothetical protein